MKDSYNPAVAESIERSIKFEKVRHLASQMLQATELAAIGAAAVAGFGDKKVSDQSAVDAMRKCLNSLPIEGTIVIGEGERDKAPMLFIGEKVGTGTGVKLAIAVDPLENTNAAASFGMRANSVLAASEVGGLIGAPDIYMDKLIVGPEARDRVYLDAPVADNLANIANALGREISDLAIVVLDRDRNEKLIADIRQAGARVRLVPDGDLMPGVAACMRGSGVHAVMGIGAAPEGVLTAAGVRSLNGGMQGRFWTKDAAQAKRLETMGGDPNKIYTASDLASGEMMIFSATGVTDGELTEGVRFFGGGARTHSLLIASSGNMTEIAYIDRTHVFNPADFKFQRS